MGPGLVGVEVTKVNCPCSRGHRNQLRAENACHGVWPSEPHAPFWALSMGSPPSLSPSTSKEQCAASHLSNNHCLSEACLGTRHQGRRFGFFSNYLFIFGCAKSSVLHGLFSSCSEQGATLELQCIGFSLQQLLLLQSTGSRALGLQ